MSSEISIGEKIKTYRKLKNMTQEDLSKESDLYLSTIKKYETDTSITQNPVSAPDENKNRLLLTNKGIKKSAKPADFFLYYFSSTT